MSQDIDEWEYEYDQDVTETFLVDLDLSSLNAGFKSNVPGKRPLDRPEGAGNTIIHSLRVQATPTEGNVESTPSNDSIELDGPFGSDQNPLQILDFHSGNPIVSYQDVVYSCAWSDVIGTNIFFAPKAVYWPDVEGSIDLLGMSRIRLIGHRAKVAARQEPEANDTAKQTPVLSFSMNPHINNAMKRQASFLEKLMDMKRQKGDADIVRTVAPTARLPSTLETVASSPDAAARREKIDKLNRRVVKGDSEAMARLQDMYVEHEEDLDSDALDAA